MEQEKHTANVEHFKIYIEVHIKSLKYGYTFIRIYLGRLLLSKAKLILILAGLAKH